MNQISDLFTVPRLARSANVTRPTVYRHIGDGTLKAVRLGWEYVITPAEAAAYITRAVRGEFKVGRPRKVKPVAEMEGATTNGN